MTKKRKLKYRAVKQCFTALFCQVYQQFFPFHKTPQHQKSGKTALKNCACGIKDSRIYQICISDR